MLSGHAAGSAGIFHAMIRYKKAGASRCPINQRAADAVRIHSLVWR
jgi:hypothetical protein